MGSSLVAPSHIVAGATVAVADHGAAGVYVADEKMKGVRNCCCSNDGNVIHPCTEGIEKPRKLLAQS